MKKLTEMTVKERCEDMERMVSESIDDVLAQLETALDVILIDADMLETLKALHKCRRELEELQSVANCLTANIIHN